MQCAFGEAEELTVLAFDEEAEPASIIDRERVPPLPLAQLICRPNFLPAVMSLVESLDVKSRHSRDIIRDGLSDSERHEVDPRSAAKQPRSADRPAESDLDLTRSRRGGRSPL